ncbi:MAG: methyltransferase domain-containing protein [Ignavibacteriales bacterium]|nr:methyltransferase domain-containing protein [Ignavibacteriales bacterium]
MAIVASTASKEELRDRILTAVQEMYEQVATCPSKTFHFPTGRTACEYVGYTAAELDAIPTSAVESFAGVGCPFKANVIRQNDTVLDVGCGSGTDMHIALLKTGSNGNVYGLDMTEAMIEKAKANASLSGSQHISVINGNAETIPLPDNMFNVVTSNGVLNLVPDKSLAFQEIFRVLKRGGFIQIADIVLGSDLSEKSRNNPQLWAECIVGAMPEEKYLEIIRAAGFHSVTVIERLDYFKNSTNDSTRNVARQFAAISIVLVAQKP